MSKKKDVCLFTLAFRGIRCALIWDEKDPSLFMGYRWEHGGLASQQLTELRLLGEACNPLKINGFGCPELWGLSPTSWLWF